jgi:hypothetical protein
MKDAVVRQSAKPDDPEIDVEAEKLEPEFQ